MDQEAFELMASYKGVIDYLIQKIEDLDKRLIEADKKISDTESLIFDEIVGPARDAMSNYEKDKRFEDFSATYGDQLKPYQDQFAPFEGDDFDITREAFDEYENIPEDQRPDAGDYVNEVINVAQDKIKQIKAALGIPEDANLQINETDDEVEVKADGETVEVEQKDDDGEAAGEPDVPAEPEADVSEEVEAGVPSDDGESVEDFEASLKKSL